MKILITDLAYFHHNYGAQALLLPLIEKIRNRIDAEISITISDTKYIREDKIFAKKNNLKLFIKPRLKSSTLFSLNDWIQLKKYNNLIKQNDVIIDLAGIEFIGNLPKTTKWKELLNVIFTQKLAEKYDKIYLKYTKSYGPFIGKFYRRIIKSHFNKLPFLMVRGEENLKNLEQMNLKTLLYSFPDISIGLNAESKTWAKKYLEKMLLKGKIVGISPSVVIRNIKQNSRQNCSGKNHKILSKMIIKQLIDKGNSVLIIPHSIGDGKDLTNCDLAFAKEIYAEIENDKLFILNDTSLAYKEVRAIIGQLDFYITGRYHSLVSALTIKIPVIALSWHTKYNDIMSLFHKKYLAINCRKKSIDDAFAEIDEFYQNRNWFDENYSVKMHKKLIAEIDKSIHLLFTEIEKKR
ncbi:MAG: polysaccharide pyruvyl transferase family protein [Candidatus Cloacimonetes bacterium]|jgi:polysaccharide pyruvyl transferase WcaK-like protein|nr:polysaccharide pyruvyl transferase family protein [Candidatus Cloacimonadota bacterium]MBT6993743.1 polysaccharide pyruvyl transferase family protein [Candidatus Cloacimonadota bacterium]MBT7469051.1 polysaccharide pyruvyl transferase family protein [Candidatus Cloacimonadota bacterium]